MRNIPYLKPAFWLATGAVVSAAATNATLSMRAQALTTRSEFDDAAVFLPAGFGFSMIALTTALSYALTSGKKDPERPAKMTLAHLGGIVIGLGLGYMLSPEQPEPLPKRQPVGIHAFER